MNEIAYYLGWVICSIFGLAIAVGLVFGILQDLANGLHQKKDNLDHRHCPEYPRASVGDFTAGFLTDEALHDLDNMFK